MEKQTQEENKSLPIDEKTILLKALQEIVRKLFPIRQDHICNDICTIAENAIKEYRNLPNEPSIDEMKKEIESLKEQLAIASEQVPKGAFDFNHLNKK